MICFCPKYSRQPLAKLFRGLLQLPMSFPRKRESRLIRLETWMPAPRVCGGRLYAGMTISACRRVVSLNDFLARPNFLTELIGVVLVCVALGFGPRSVHGADAKPAWQAEWEKVLAAAKKEGQVAVYISGYEEVLPDFQKEYPEIKVLSVTGRGSQIGQRLIAERRGEKFLADVVSSGGVTTYQHLHPAKVFDPIKPALLLPEITDPSKWYQGRHHYADPENQYVFSYVGSAT